VKLWLRMLVLPLLVVGIVLLPSGWVADAAPAGPPPEYLALGDSLAVGVGSAETGGYVPLVHAYLGAALTPGRSPDPPGAQNGAWLKVRNLGVGGETTTSMIGGGQLAHAVAILEKQNGDRSPDNDVKVVTLDIGGNDLAGLIGLCASPGVTVEQCQLAAYQAVGAFGSNFAVIVAQLRAAAGPDTPIVVMTYYNPLAGGGCPAVDASLAGAVVAALNSTIAAVASAYDALVADAASAGIGAGDLAGDCLHPNDSGYQKIAGAFINAIDP
jgi:lysophospholipase L1-like esterase